MSNILDLSVYREQTLDIRTEDGKLLHITKPSEAMIIELMQFREINDDTPPAEIIAALDRITTLILNHNKEKITFNESDISALSMEAKTAILSAYSKFATELQSNPT